MKSPLARSSGGRRGIALISVLAVLVLLTLLIVAFLMRAQVARNASANYHATTATRLLSDTVVNLIEAQINEATTYGSSSQATGTAPYTWASQPGAIRVYDSSGSGTGAALGLQKIYRLYSAPALTTGNVSDLLNTTTGATTEIPATWANSPAQWVDLNAPVTVSDPVAGSLTVYPILDPRNPATPTTNLTNTILPGFAITSAPGATTAQPAPMPVQWLYVLKNGQIVGPTGGSGSTVTFTAPNAPTAANPITGRIAFWTDDDTCKVNINTAAGSVAYRTSSAGTNTTAPVGGSWDTPRFGGSWEDLKLYAENQPVQGEYQRYPGHPATTILYTIFHALNISMPEISTVTSAPYKGAYNGTLDDQDGGSLPWANTSSLYGLLPRYNDNGGSQGGVANTTTTNPPTLPSANRSRLYTSLGELLYATNSSSATPPVRSLNGTNGAINGNSGITAPYLSRQQVETGKFFLTTHSNAPEVTLFGTPRITMWPIGDTTQTSSEGYSQVLTPYDKLIAFCSTTDTGKGNAGNPYYFQRYDRASQTNDWVNEPRNQSLYGYLQDLTSANIPGYGGNFLAKYGTSTITGIANERDQILTEMVDYIRCTNLYDHSGTLTTGYYTGANPGSSPGQVMPLTITSTPGTTRTASTTQGLGRLITLSEVGLHVICTASGTNNLASVNAGNANIGYSGTGNSGSSVAYNAPVIVATVSSTIPVSPVKGSASDPAYVSNLPTQQFLRDTSNNVVDIYGHVVPTTGISSYTPFPANQTLTTTGSYGDSLAALPIGSNQLQAMLVFETAAPMSGYDMMLSGSSGPSVNIHVTNIHNIQIAGQNPFPDRTDTTNGTGPNVNGNGYLNGTSAGSAGYQWTRTGPFNCLGGILGFRFPMLSLITYGTSPNQVTVNGRTNGWSGKACLVSQTATNTTDTLGADSTTCFIPGTHLGQPYRFVSNPFTVTSSTITLGGSGTFNVALEMPVKNGTTTVSTPYQTYTVGFPASPSLTPTLCAYGVSYNTGGAAPKIAVSHAPDWWSFDNRIGWASSSPNPYGITTTTPNIGLGCVVRGDNAPPAGGWGTAVNPWTWNGATAVITTAAGVTSSYGDVMRSVVPNDCDYRLTMAKSSLVANPSASTSDFMETPLYSSTQNLSNMLMDQGSSAGTPGTDVRGTLLAGGGTTFAYTPTLAPKVPITFTYGPNPQLTWDWDNGYVGSPDGAFANKPDEGNTYTSASAIPYVNIGNQGTITSYFTPNRLIASPVSFGSLPTGVAEGIPWRTLLFRPQLTVAQGGIRPATASPAGPNDYLLLDLFTMPVVQPYAISEPFSTAGKINMNYQILPFTYITRSTGIQAVIGSELVARVPGVDSGMPTSGAGSGNATAIYEGAGLPLTSGVTQTTLYTQVNASKSIVPARLPINLSDTNGTLRQFKNKFSSGDIFRSPAEICSIYLVPSDATHATYYTDWTSDAAADNTMADSWYGSRGDFALVGDNVREHPYSDIYARLTTKSNTYTVYYKVQALKNPPTADPTQWTEGTGVVTGEYRGSSSLERYLDPNNNSIPDFTISANDPAVTSTAPSLDNFYQWRVVANTAFVP